jgi:hypothetical protein
MVGLKKRGLGCQKVFQRSEDIRIFLPLGTRLAC